MRTSHRSNPHLTLQGLDIWSEPHVIVLVSESESLSDGILHARMYYPALNASNGLSLQSVMVPRLSFTLSSSTLLESPARASQQPVTSKKPTAFAAVLVLGSTQYEQTHSHQYCRSRRCKFFDIWEPRFRFTSGAAPVCDCGIIRRCTNSTISMSHHEIILRICMLLRVYYLNVHIPSLVFIVFVFPSCQVNLTPGHETVSNLEGGDSPSILPRLLSPTPILR